MPTWADIAVVTPTIRTIRSANARTAREVALARHHGQKKISKYPDLSLIPLVFEAWGRLGDGAVDFIRSLYQNEDDETRAPLMGKAWRKLQTTLLRGNVSILAAAGALIPP